MVKTIPNSCSHAFEQSATAILCFKKKKKIWSKKNHKSIHIKETKHPAKVVKIIQLKF